MRPRERPVPSASDRHDAPVAQSVPPAPDRHDAPVEQSVPFAPGRYDPGPLFTERVSAYWRTVWHCWRTALDWTVLLYIIVPALLIFGGMYADIWRSPPAWLYDVPTLVPVAAVLIVQLRGRLRTFAEPGDGLFLHRNGRWSRAMTGMGLVYGSLVRLLLAAAATGLLSPLLGIGGGYSAAAVILLAVWSAGGGVLWMLLKDRIARAWTGWRKLALLLAAYPACFALFAAAAAAGMERPIVFALEIALLCAAAVWLGFVRLSAKGSFFHEVETEREAYMSNVGWLLIDTLEKRRLPKMRKPILFARSKSLFKGGDDRSRLADLWIKSVLRRSDLLYTLLQFTGAGAAAVYLPPLFAAGIAWLVMPSLLLAWQQRLWRQWLSEPYMALFHWQHETIASASEKARRWLAAPPVVIWSVIIGVRIGFSYGGLWWGALIVVPVVGLLWLRLINGMFVSFNIKRK